MVRLVELQGRRQCLPNRVQDAVDESYRLVTAERSCELERFVDDNLRRGLRVRQQLADGQAQHQAVDHRHAFEPPVVRVRDEQLVDRFDAHERLPHEVVRELAQVVGERVFRLGITRPVQPPEGADRLLRSHAADFRLVKHLQRRRARQPSTGRVHARHDEAKPAGLVWCKRRNNLAISMAAAAASNPLLSRPLPARSSACSQLSVVRTPNDIGTPVPPAAS